MNLSSPTAPGFANADDLPDWMRSYVSWHAEAAAAMPAMPALQPRLRKDEGMDLDESESDDEDGDEYELEAEAIDEVDEDELEARGGVGTPGMSPEQLRVGGGGSSSSSSSVGVSLSRGHVVYSCRGGCGGAGDRLSGVMQAFFMAVCTNRTFSIDWNKPDPLQEYLQPNLIQWNMSSFVEVANRDEVDVIDAMEKRDHPLLNDPHLLRPDRVVAITTNVWLFGEARPFACRDDYLSRFPRDGAEAKRPEGMFRIGFWTLFRWSDLVVRRVAELRRQLPLSSPYVAVHLRTGRVATYQDALRRSNNESYWPLYYRCAKALQSGLERKCNDHVRHQGSQRPIARAPIFLASDTADAKRALLSWDQDGSIRTQVDEEIINIGHPLGAVQNRSEAELSVFADLKLLIDSTCLVLSQSRYSSYLGRWLGSQPRCAVHFKRCDPARVEAALSHVDPALHCG
jgi:hypothetical protein